MKVRTLTTIFFLIVSLSVFGQTNRALHWCFGWRAALDFSSGQPVADTTRNLESIEGSSCISDTSGNLLFYSNGETVWNRNNDTMPNSGGLLGFQSGEQSSLIVPKPESNSLYYLFTSGSGFLNYPFSYSIIDMNLDGGLGDVTSSKNIILFNDGTEGLGGTTHCNAKDYWILGRQRHTDTLQFFAYLLDSTGLSDPVISTFYIHSPSWNSFGFITFSQDGSLMSFSSFGNPLCVFNFDTQSGLLTFSDSISANTNEQLYSNALSPDRTKIYITSWTPGNNCYLTQFDLTAANITASRINLDSVDFSNGSPNGYGFIGQLQLAPDQRIYVSRWKQTPPPVNPNTEWSLDSLDVIHNPNAAGITCNFQQNWVYLKHRPTELGLPNFISNFTSPTIPTTPANHCSISITTYPDSEIKLELFPNPFWDQTTLRTNLSSDQKLKVQLIDVFGREVIPTINFYSSTIEIEKGNLKSGIYLLKLWNDKKLIAITNLIAL